MAITVTDIFAGAGGSSTGMVAVPGVHVAVSANHWKLAVDVHQENHPDTLHACVDLHREDPRNFPRTDVLWASPECSKWSIANSKAKELSVEMGGDPTLFDAVPVELESTNDDEISRSRLLMFDVLRFVEYHRYRVVVVENVVDIATQAKYAAAWVAWRKGLQKLGYRWRIVSLNSMHAQLAGHPAPQSRDRLYIVAWPEGEKAPDLDRALSPWAWCPRCTTEVQARQAWKPGRDVGRYRAQYVYNCGHCGMTVEPGWLPAASAIDWSLPAERIADRKRPLSDKTMARIREGLRRYGTGAPLLQRHNNGAGNAGGAHLLTPTTEPMRTLTTTGHQSVVDPRAFIIEAAGNTYDMASGSGNQYLRAWPTTEPLRTLHGTASKGLVLDAIKSAPIIRSTDEPLATQTTAYTRSLLIPVEGRDGKSAATVAEPMRTGRWFEHEPKPIIPSTPVLDREPATITEDDVMACRFRMLEPHEIALGMAFPADYKWQGTKRERVRLAGNAVTPPAARDLLTVIAQTLEA